MAFNIFAQTNNESQKRPKQELNPYMEKEIIQNKAVTETNVSNELPEGFPIYKNTGNKELDDAKYTQEKNTWIEKNPEKYKKMFKQAPPSASDIEQIKLKEENKQ